MIPVFDYLPELEHLEDELVDSLLGVLRSGQLVLGPQTEAFEQEFAAWTGARHCVAVTSGTMALYAALRCQGVGAGDEVITVANTCPPTISAIRMTGAEPVFVDVDPDTLMLDTRRLEDVVTPRSKAILPVHLWGGAVNMKDLLAAARTAGLAVIEDCAQATGTHIDGRHVGTFGNIGCFSFYPTKNLGAFGDGGAVVTNDADLAARMRRLRMYGYDGAAVSLEDGFNARINEVQAAFLHVKLQRLDNAVARRRDIAARYMEAMTRVRFPEVPAGVEHAWHQFVVRSDDRDALQRRLDAAGIGWGIHYAVPVHRMPAFERYSRSLPVTETAAAEILSLPVHPNLSDDDVGKIIAAVEG